MIDPADPLVQAIGARFRAAWAANRGGGPVEPAHVPLMAWLESAVGRLGAGSARKLGLTDEDEIYRLTQIRFYESLWKALELRKASGRFPAEDALYPDAVDRIRRILERLLGLEGLDDVD
jgi:hypothetical protein